MFTAETHYSSQVACQAHDATAAGWVSYYTYPNCNAIPTPGQTGLVQYPETTSTTMVCATPPTVTSTTGGFILTKTFATSDCTGTPLDYNYQQLGLCIVTSGQSNTNPRTYSNTDSYMLTASTAGGVTTVSFNFYTGSTTCTGTPNTEVVGSTADGCVFDGDRYLLHATVTSAAPIDDFSSAYYYAAYNTEAGCLAATDSSLIYVNPMSSNTCYRDTTWSSTGTRVTGDFYSNAILVGCNAASFISTPPSVSPTSAPTHGSPSTPIAHAVKPVHPPSAKTGASAASKHSKHAHVRKSSTSGNGKVDVEVDVDVKVDVK